MNQNVPTLGWYDALSEAEKTVIEKHLRLAGGLEKWDRLRRHLVSALQRAKKEAVPAPLNPPAASTPAENSLAKGSKGDVRRRSCPLGLFRLEQFDWSDSNAFPSWF